MKSCIATIFLACMLMLNGVSVSAAEAEVAPMDLSRFTAKLLIPLCWKAKYVQQDHMIGIYRRGKS